MPDIGDVQKYVGAMALACFGGTFLGGMLLSYFWKTFGPWKTLEEVKRDLEKCEAAREVSRQNELRTNAELAEVKARFEILREAMFRSGIELRLDTINVEQRLIEVRRDRQTVEEVIHARTPTKE